MVQPSATIFNTAVIVCGVLIILAAFFLHRSFRSWAVTIAAGLSGVGFLGVGIFPADHGNVHAGFALLTFIVGAVAAILAYKIEAGPFRYFSVVLGVVSLAVLALYFILGDSSPLDPPGLGRDGTLGRLPDPVVGHRLRGIPAGAAIGGSPAEPGRGAPPVKARRRRGRSRQTRRPAPADAPRPLR